MPLNVVGALLCFGLVASSSAIASAESSKDECIDANEAAQRLSRTGSLVEARAQLQICTRPECPGPVRQDCLELAQKIEVELPTVLLRARDAKGVEVTAVSVTMDGQPLTSVLDSTPVAVNPGWHRFRFEASGQPSASEGLFVHARDKGKEIVVDLVDTTGPILKKVGIGAGIAGALALSAGVYFGLQSRATYRDALGHCPSGPNSCDAQGVQGGSDAHDEASKSTVAFVLGGVLVGGGAALYWYGARLSVAPVVAPRGDAAGLSLRGAW